MKVTVSVKQRNDCQSCDSGRCGVARGVVKGRALSVSHRSRCHVGGEVNSDEVTESVTKGYVSIKSDPRTREKKTTREVNKSSTLRKVLDQLTLPA